jgi:hypothetical protein
MALPLVNNLTVQKTFPSDLTATLKPKAIKPQPENPEINYVIDIYTTFYRNYFYFCGAYACPSPNALSPTFKIRFARMECMGDRLFNLSCMRHTGQWFESYLSVSIDERFQATTMIHSFSYDGPKR